MNTRRRFLVSCFSEAENKSKLESPVLAQTPADAAIRFCNLNQLGNPYLPLRVETPEKNGDERIQVWSVGAPANGFHVWIREHV